MLIATGSTKPFPWTDPSESLARAQEAGSEEEVANLQREIEEEEMKRQQLYERRDALGDRLRIFGMNLEFAKEASQAFFEKVLGGADLLNLPDVNSAAGTHIPNLGSNPVVLAKDTNDAAAQSAEEDTGRAVFEELICRGRDIQLTQQQFDGFQSDCSLQRKAYEASLANGHDVPTRTNFDLMLLDHGMKITACLIEEEKAYELAKDRAKALKVISEHWGDPEYNEPWEAQSAPEDEVVAYQKTRNWSRVEDWRQGVSDSSDETISEPIDIDEWDAKPVNLSDSISAVAHIEHESKNIKRWQDIRGCR